MMKKPVILLVDDEEAIVTSLRGGLEDEGYIVITATDGVKAVDIVKSQPLDIVFLDIWLPGIDGLETLKAIKDFDSDIDVVIMTGHGTVSTAVQAVKQGAFDFLEKPFSLDTVLDIIHKIEHKRAAIRSDMSRTPPSEEPPALIGTSHTLRMLQEKISQLASGNSHVTICGETGTGKELIARLIHAGSRAAKRRFEKCNAAFYAPEEIEAELFGLPKTADASASRTGLLRDRSIGTLFFESLFQLPPRLQQRLADAIGKASAPRIIASMPLTAGADEEPTLQPQLAACFSESLLVPPLRERRGDIPVLLEYFIKQYCMEYNCKEKTIDDAALELLVNYDWPGNVKELKNMAEKLVVSVPTSHISIHDIPLAVRDELQHSMSRYYERYRSMDDAEAAWRKNYILYHLRKNNRDIAATAAQIRVKEKTLKKYIRQYGIVIAGKKKTPQLRQRTLKRSMVLSGRGLHSGDKTGIILTPLPPNSGIVFGNISTGETVRADIDNVVSTELSTCVQANGAIARTIEHFLATLHAYRITNLMIKINNEVPIMDGSAVDFCQVIEDAGIEEQDAPLEEIIVTDRYVLGEVKKNAKFIMIEPADVFSISYTLQYPKPVGTQEYTFVLKDEEMFKTEIAPARTFGFLKDVEAMEKKGLASGGRLNNVILIDDEKIVNTDLRYPDEFARHKILDMMGDLYLLGRPIRGKITANMTGHTENAAFVRMLRDKLGL
ncbi:MAG: UDP-3-O-acyl-N-acetylglucosamine deacetylase [Desulfobacterota bacterium]|nr:UDP-3-O-acyl-N-acetylglucosamine deacetylase [Thermodesulfobacteriota bacterium]